MTDRADISDDALRDARRELKRLREERDRLRSELEAVRAEAGRRNDALEALRAELGIVRTLSDKLRATITESVAGKRQLASVWRYLLRDDRRVTQAEAIRKSGVFDAAWYLKRYPDVAEAAHDPLTHYLKWGAWEGRDPHPLFDSRWYCSAYPDVARQKWTPLGHFVRSGAAKGYDPNPLFHTAWYVAKNPDVIAENANPLRHYMDHAAEPGRNPNPLFDSAWYLSENPDVAEAGENPLCHYFHHGIAELRDPHPLFNTQWYLEQYKHVDMAGMDALEHYLTVGAFEGCRPGPERADEMVARPRRSQPLRKVGRGPFEPQSDVHVGSALSDHEPSRSLPAPTDIMRWQTRVDPGRRAASRFTGQIGVFVHLFYGELAEEIAASLLAIPFDFKVYVSTNDSAKKAHIEDVFQQFGLDPLVKILPNRGWDVAPFVLGFIDEMRSHEICLKLHGKRSRHSSDRFGARWREHLLSGLLGDRRNVSRIVESFVANPELGILMTPHWRGVGHHAKVIGPSYQALQALLNRANMSISSNQRIEFPSGSMFWFRAKALGPLLDLGLTWFDFRGCRPRSVDATIAHGIERSMLIFAAKAGFKWAFVPRSWTLRSWMAAAPRNWVRGKRSPSRAKALPR